MMLPPAKSLPAHEYVVCTITDPCKLYDQYAAAHKDFTDQMHMWKNDGVFRGISRESLLKLTIYKQTLEHNMFDLDCIITGLSN